MRRTQRPRSRRARSGYGLRARSRRISCAIWVDVNQAAIDPSPAICPLHELQIQFRFRSKESNGRRHRRHGRRKMLRERGDRCSGCANAYDSVGRIELVVQRLCGFCAAPRNSGGDGVPIELPAGGAELLHVAGVMVGS